MRDPFLLFVLLMCIYPLLFWAIPAYAIGRWRLRLRSPLVATAREQQVTREEERQQIRRIVAREEKDRIGYGAPK